MSKQIEALKDRMPPPPRRTEEDSTMREKRDKTIRIRTFNYNRLAKLGDLSEDFDTALTKVLDFWEKHHKND